MTEGTREIHELIAQWHDVVPLGRPLYDFLGLTQEQYGAWVEGHPLPQGCGLYDAERRKVREAKGKDQLALEKKASRMARGRLAKLYRSDYQRLFSECMKELREEAKDAGGEVTADQ